MSILSVKNLGINFGGLRALDKFHLEINKGELIGLIGPNGAGKTTVFNLLTGVYQASEGEIILDNQKINGLSSDKIARIGISRTFQNIRLFQNLSVLDNVKIGMHSKYEYSFIEGILKLKKYKLEEKIKEEEALKLLKIFNLDVFASYKASSLSYGKQRELEIVRALAGKPKLLLLDEPAAGMNPNETIELMNTIKKIQESFEVAILLIEHDMKLVLGICEKITVLNYGRVLSCGKKDDVINDKEVIKAYLGE